MDHKISYKTKDGVIKEQVFDNFNEFADTIDMLAGEHYLGSAPSNINVETIYDGIVRQEKVSYGYESNTGDINLLTEQDRGFREDSQ